MKLEDFGFNTVLGNSYTVTFTSDGNLIKTFEYNGTPITDMNLPDRTKVTITVTDRLTGKEVFESDLYQYNGVLYNAIVDLPLTSGDNNMNANVYIKDLHYDLASGNILIGVQGFNGESYSLTVADVTTNHKVLTMPIVLQDNTYYSLSTEMVQGNRFEVTLADSHNVPLDLYDFTAPLTTSYRYTDDGVKELNTAPAQTAAVPVATTQTGTEQLSVQGQEQVQTTEGVLLQADESSWSNQTPVYIGVGLVLLLFVIIFVRHLVKTSGRNKKSGNEDSYEDEELYDEEEHDAYQDEVAASSEDSDLYDEPTYEEADPKENDRYEPRDRGVE